jgi:branched-chain amino acid transport system permease protein
MRVIKTSLAILPIFALLLIPIAAADNSFAITLALIFIIYTTVALSWNIIGGMAGQLNLGHAVFFGMGAYSMAVSTILGFHPYLGVLLGGLVALGLSIAMIPLLRLRGDYFAIGTLSLAEAIKTAILNIHAYGIRVTPDPSLGRFENYYFAASILVATIFVTYLILHSRYKLAFYSIRENEKLAEANGINPTKYKVMALMLSASITGLVGGIYGYNLLYVPAEHVFSIEWTIIPVFMVLIGGRGTLLGPLIGSLIYLAVYYTLQFTITETSLLAFGIILVLIMKFMPNGLVEEVLIKRLGVKRTSIV